MPVPFEIIAAPFSAYLAPVGEAYPAIEDVIAGNWVQVGTGGDRSYTEDGVTISHPQNNEIVRGLGATGPLKVFRTEENLVVTFTVLDLTLEAYRLVLNSNTVTTTAAGGGAAGFKEVNMYRGSSVSQNALLIRGLVSPYGDGWNTQFQVPVVFQTGSPEVVMQKFPPAGLSFEFTAIEDPNAATTADRFGKLIAQNAAPV